MKNFTLGKSSRFSSPKHMFFVFFFYLSFKHCFVLVVYFTM